MDKSKRIIKGKEFDINNISEDCFEHWVKNDIDLSRLSFIPASKVEEFITYRKTHKSCAFCGKVFSAGEEGETFHKKPVCFDCYNSREFLEYKQNYDDMLKNLARKNEEKRKTLFRYKGIDYDIFDTNFYHYIRKAGVSCLKAYEKCPWFAEYKKFFKDTFVCSFCGEVYLKSEKNNVSKKQFCKSPKCAEERIKYNDKVVENRKSSNLKKWGKENPTQCDEIKQKTKETQIEKYGGWYRNTEDYKIKSKKTKFERYGDENYSNRELAKETCLRKFGRENVFSGKEGNNIAKNGMLSKHGVSHPSKMSGFKEKWTNSINSKFGSQKRFHEYLTLCQINKFGKFNTQMHITNFENYNPEFWVENFVNTESEPWVVDLDEIKKYHNISNKEYIMDKLKAAYPDKNMARLNGNSKQKDIFDAIDAKDKIFNDRSLLRPLEIDILFPLQKLGVEYNGLIFHSFGSSDWSAIHNVNIDKNASIKKLKLCESCDVELLNIFEGEKINLWINEIQDKLNLLEFKPLTNCEYITTSEISTFIQNNSLKPCKKASIHAGGYRGNNLVCVMSFAKRKYGYEIVNYAAALGENSLILSELYDFVIKDIQAPKRLYFDKRWGKMPKFLINVGAKKIKTLPPRPYYFIETKSKLIPESILFREFVEIKNLKKEDKINYLFDNNFRLIYDCGIDIFEIL